MTNEYNAADIEALVDNELAQGDDAGDDDAVVEEAAEVTAKAPKKDFKQRSIFVVEDEDGKEHEFRSKVEVDKFLAGPRVKKALLEIEGADDTLVAFLMANEAAIKAAYAIASPEAKKRVISEETREKMREAMKARIASGAITPIAKKVDVETAAVSE